MTLRYDEKRHIAVDDDAAIEIKHSAKPGENSHRSYARYSRKGVNLFIPYYYFNKDVLDRTAFGMSPARRPYKAIIPTSPIEFYNFSRLFSKLTGYSASQDDYQEFLAQVGQGLLLCFKANGDWDKYLEPYEIEVMDWRDAHIYVDKIPTE